MTDRERAKEALLKAMGNSYLNLDAMLDAVILVVDPIIRADERERSDSLLREAMHQRDAARAEVAAWERIWRLLGEPGVIGESKAEATWVAVRNLLDWIACGGPVEAKRAKREADRDRVEASND